ncbi:hypothetical protein GJ496_010910 [Pomphorhynchus laevis]|nr:hypothetical protein GJ496_010910 [Pomphorhynchus laevis]
MAEHHNLLSYISQLPDSKSKNIYEHTSSCLGVLRSLDTMTQHIVLRLILMKIPVLRDVVYSWIPDAHSSKISQIEDQLCNLKIIKAKDHQTLNKTVWYLKHSFKTNLFAAIYMGEKTSLESIGSVSVKEVNAVHLHMTRQWEATLEILLDKTYLARSSSESIIRILQHANLLSRSPEKAITGKGFNFLLSNRQSQLWTLIKSVLDLSQESDDISEYLILIFQLYFSSTKQKYSLNLPPEKIAILRIFDSVGIIKINEDCRYEYFIVSSLSKEILHFNTDTINDSGFLICENNYRLYAYTSSDFKIKLLQLFCHVLYRLPNMCCCLLTRISLKNALEKGIAADSVIEFLGTNLTRKSNSMKQTQDKLELPQVIKDQIKLWEIENIRVTAEPGYVYTLFDSKVSFDMLSSYAENIGCLLFRDDIKLIMVIHEKGHDDVRRFWKNHRNSTRCNPK